MGPAHHLLIHIWKNRFCSFENIIYTDMLNIHNDKLPQSVHLELSHTKMVMI